MSRIRSLILVAVIAGGLGLMVGQVCLSTGTPVRAQEMATATAVVPEALEGSSNLSFQGAGPAQPDGTLAPQALPVSPGLSYRSFGGIDFQPYDSRDLLAYDFAVYGRSLITTTSPYPAEIVAPLQLPQGATVREVLFYFRDSSSADLSLGLVQQSLETGSFSTVLTYTTGISNTAVLSASMPISPAWTIDNSQMSYFVLVGLSDVGPRQVIRSARVGYSMSTVMLPAVSR